MDDIESDIRLHTSLPVRIVLAFCGVLFVILGIIGAFLPILPTTPFILLAAACFARSSSRFYKMLITNRVFGPAIRDWHKYRCISYRTKQFATILIVVTFACSIGFFIPNLYVKIGMALFGISMLVWIWHIPTCNLQVVKQR